MLELMQDRIAQPGCRRAEHRGFDQGNLKIGEGRQAMIVKHGKIRWYHVARQHSDAQARAQRRVVARQRGAAIPA